MLQLRLCHSVDAHRATDDDKQTYVISARVTPRKGVTHARAVARETAGRRGAEKIPTGGNGDNRDGKPSPVSSLFAPLPPVQTPVFEIAKVSHLSHELRHRHDRKKR